jgi:hypothetical protein
MGMNLDLEGALLTTMLTYAGFAVDCHGQCG